MELIVREYVSKLGLNPNNVYYQKIISNNVNTNLAHWDVKIHNKRALLLPTAWIDWRPTITKRVGANNADDAFNRNGIYASFKPCMPFTNASSKIQIRINNGDLVMSEPRHFSDHLNMLYAGRRGAKKLFSQGGGSFPDLTGYHSNEQLSRGCYAIGNGPIVFNATTVFAQAVNNLRINDIAIPPDYPWTGGVNPLAAEFTALMNAWTISVRSLGANPAIPLVASPGANILTVDGGANIAWTGGAPTSDQFANFFRIYIEHLRLVEPSVSTHVRHNAGVFSFDGLAPALPLTHQNPTTAQMAGILNNLFVNLSNGDRVLPRIEASVGANTYYITNGGREFGLTAAGITDAQLVTVMNKYSNIFTYENKNSYVIIDYEHMKNEERFREKLTRSANNDNLMGLNNIVINSLEPILAPPFNPYLLNTKNLPKYSWFKNMSPMIGNLSHLDVNYSFQNLGASAIMTRYLSSFDAAQNVVGRLTISDLTAQMYLWWYNPPMSMTLPKEIKLQTWDVYEYPTILNNNVAINNNTTLVGISTQMIPIHSVYSLVVIHAEVDKDSASYTNQAINGDTNQFGTNAATSLNNNSLDSYMEISNFQAVLGDRPQVISTIFTQEELYQLTLKNSNADDFPYSFDEWRGAYRVSPIASAERYNQMSKCFVAFRPKDLSEYLPEGAMVRSQQIQFTMDLTARDGFHNLAGGNKIYKLYVHVYHGNRYINIAGDSAEYVRDDIVIDRT
ncbi:MAG: hypothetical protein GY756_27825 [bacterium]|nr:hypothetical protein [bacterium]